MENSLILNRKFAQPTRWTFTMAPVRYLLSKYVKDGKGWIDPYAGKYSPAEYTNDINPKMPTTYHLDAVEFCNLLAGPFNGVLFDPPYSYRQVKECYEGLGIPVHQADTQNRFWNRVIEFLVDKIIPGGYVISFGWNSHGFGKSRGFKLIEVLLIMHGGHHNDTIVTVEQKVRTRMNLT